MKRFLTSAGGSLRKTLPRQKSFLSRTPTTTTKLAFQKNLIQFDAKFNSTLESAETSKTAQTTVNAEKQEAAATPKLRKKSKKLRKLLLLLAAIGIFIHQSEKFEVYNVRNEYTSTVEADIRQFIQKYAIVPSQATVRFLRSCYYIARIMIVYKLFFNKNIDREKEEMRYFEEFGKTHLEAAKLFLTLCQENKGAFVKAGQYLSSLQYTLPKEITDTLSVLQDKAPYHSYAETIQIFKEEFGGLTPEEVYASFDVNPIASASIAQVHVATTKDTNEKVAVKIQHPDIQKQVNKDVFTMRFLMGVVKWYFDFRLDWVLSEFEKMLKQELDFVHEGMNSERFAHLFKDVPQVTSPKIFWDKTSQRVLTMKFMEGFKVTDKEQLAKYKISKKEVAELVVTAFSQQIFINGFVHADPHPGNLFITFNKELGKPQLIVLDHGAYKELDEQTRMDYAGLWKAMVDRDEPMIVHYTERFNIQQRFSKFLAMILTLNNFFNDDKQMLDQRVRKKLTKEERQEFKKRVKAQLGLKEDEPVDFFKITQDMFGEAKRDLLLLSRTNAYMRSIIYDLDRPINSFGIMAEYCVRGFNTRAYLIERDVTPRDGNVRRVFLNEVYTPTLRERLRLFWQLIKLKFQILQLNMFFYLWKWSQGKQLDLQTTGKSAEPARFDSPDTQDIEKVRVD